MKFHERFNINYPTDLLKQNFIKRVNIMVMDEIVHETINYPASDKIERNVALAVGQEIRDTESLCDYYENDFNKCLQVLEVLYFNLVKLRRRKLATTIGKTIKDIIDMSEGDLGIAWKNGIFIKKGAELLDKELINKPLVWLERKKYPSVYEPFSHGLKNFIAADKNPTLLKSVITEMYESVESLAKIVTGRDKDLSANKELFIKSINCSTEYKEILKDYIVYANHYRHAESLIKDRPELKLNEVESFVYMTGIFIRLCIQSV